MPAAIAFTVAVSFGEAPAKNAAPQSELRPDNTAIVIHSPKMYFALRPALRIPTALESPSGKFERKIAASMAMLTPFPLKSVRPRTTLSGIPSRSEPTAIAIPAPVPACCC